MSAFQSYAGAYEFRGGRFTWRCYATTRVYGVRSADHGPLPKAPEGKKWIRLSPHQHGAAEVGWLVDETVVEFSQILLQVQPDALTSLRVAANAERATA